MTPNDAKEAPAGKQGFVKRLKHAFAVDPPGPPEPTEEQRAAIEAFCRWIVRRRLTTPGLAFIGLMHPLNYILSQGMVFFSPVVRLFSERGGYRHVAAFLEKRSSIEYICRRIEEIEEQAERVEKQRASEAAGTGNNGESLMTNDQ